MTVDHHPSTLHLFEGYGIELEYMIVDRNDLSVLPVADQVILAESGQIVGEIECGKFCWSNELALHVIELKTNGPAPQLNGLGSGFLSQIRRIDEILTPLGGMLLPTAMHPLMDPHRETKLWPHEQSAIYAAYDRIFGCQGHGWSNLQSMHINLPFADDREFARLHGAIRVLLPLLPGLAASSPMMDGRVSGFIDTRLLVYSKNQKKFLSIIGSVIPEPVVSKADYQARILDPMYREIASSDPECILQGEWLNSRGAIARFERMAIEIRLLDVQETPLADLAIAWLTCQIVRQLTEERWVPIDQLQKLDTLKLAAIFQESIRIGEQTIIDDQQLLSALGYSHKKASIGELWHHLAEQLDDDGEYTPVISQILDRGPLARRLLRKLGADPSKQKVVSIYRELGQCLVDGVLLD